MLNRRASCVALKPPVAKRMKSDYSLSMPLKSDCMINPSNGDSGCGNHSNKKEYWESLSETEQEQHKQDAFVHNDRTILSLSQQLYENNPTKKTGVTLFVKHVGNEEKINSNTPSDTDISYVPDMSKVSLI